MGICIRLQTLRHPVKWRDNSRSLAHFLSLAFLPTVQFSRKWLSGFCSGPVAGNEDTGGDILSCLRIVSKSMSREKEKSSLASHP